MPQIPDEKRRELLLKAQQAGIPQEQAFRDLAALEGEQAVVPDQGEPGKVLSKAGGAPTVISIPDRPNITPRLARQLLAGGAAGLAAPFTAGMSLIPAALTEGAIVGTADLGLQGLRNLQDPTYDVKPKESLEIGTYSALGSGLTRGILTAVQRLAGRLGGVPQAAIQEVTEKAPFGGRKAAKMIKAAPQDAEYQLAKAAQKSIKVQRAPSLAAGEAAVKQYKGQVDSTPIFDRIMSRYRATPVNKAEEAANKALEDLASRLPQSMTMEQMEEYLRRIRIPVKDAIGKEGGALAVQDVIDVQSFIRQYRDDLLGKAGLGEGVEAFAKSSQEIDAIKKFKDLLLDPKGNLRRSAENTLRRIPSNRVIMDVIERYDKASGTTFAQQAKALALKRQWTPTDLQDAGALTEMLAQVKRGTGVVSKFVGPPGRAVAKGITVAVPPRGYPKVIAGAVSGASAAEKKEEERRKKAIRVGPNP